MNCELRLRSWDWAVLMGLVVLGLGCLGGKNFGYGVIGLRVRFNSLGLKVLDYCVGG